MPKPKTTTSTIGARLRELRLEAGLTQDQVAAAANVTRSAISWIESGLKAPSIETLERILEAVGAHWELVPNVRPPPSAPASTEPPGSPPATGPKPRR